MGRESQESGLIALSTGADEPDLRSVIQLGKIAIDDLQTREREKILQCKERERKEQYEVEVNLYLSFKFKEDQTDEGN